MKYCQKAKAMLLNDCYRVLVLGLACAFLGSCGLRPDAVPEEAHFVGSWKDGVWISCASGEAPECEIFNRRGRPYLIGRFAIVESVNSCTRAYMSSVFPIEGRYLVPVSAHDAYGRYYVFGSPTAEGLPDAISQAMSATHDLVRTRIEIDELDVCGDGTYRVLVSGQQRIEGRVWAGRYFEVLTET